MSINWYIEDDVIHQYRPEIVYTIHSILYRAGIETEQILQPLSAYTHENRNDISIIYSSNSPVRMNNNDCYIWCDRDFWLNHTLPEMSPLVFEYEGIRFPVLYQYSKTSSPLSREGDGIKLHFDLLASVFFMLGRLEEYNKFEPDQHRRFPAKASWAAQAGYIHIPCVDLWVFFLARILSSFSRVPFSMSLLNDRTFINLTFDIDLIRYYNIRRILGAPLIGVLKEKKLTSFFTYGCHAVQYLCGRRSDPYHGFPDIKKMLAAHNAVTTFFVIPQARTSWEDYDLFNEPRNQDILKAHISDEHELALHVSYDCVDDPQDLMREKEKLEGIFQRTVSGVRHHYLRFSTPLSWTATEEAGLKYDATLGYSEHEGFRAGTAFPFIPFDLTNRREINIIEIPLTVMDVTLRYHRRLNPKQATRVLNDLLSTCAGIKGIISILWHTSNLGWFGWEEWRAMLESFMNEAASNPGIGIISGSEIASNARQRWETIKTHCLLAFETHL